MRENLFRGKRQDADEWVEGYFAIDPTDEALYLKDKPCIICALTAEWFEVIPETVGQFTGKLDADGKRVFEGDILYAKITFDDGSGGEECLTVVWDLKLAGFVGQCDAGVVDLDYAEDYKIIGNIHETYEAAGAETAAGARE